MRPRRAFSSLIQAPSAPEYLAFHRQRPFKPSRQTSLLGLLLSHVAVRIFFLHSRLSPISPVKKGPERPTFSPLVFLFPRSAWLPAKRRKPPGAGTPIPHSSDIRLRLRPRAAPRAYGPRRALLIPRTVAVPAAVLRASPPQRHLARAVCLSTERLNERMQGRRLRYAGRGRMPQDNPQDARGTAGCGHASMARL